MKKICIVLRVYNRIEDIELNLEIIRNTWKKNEYYIIVTCNGKSNDYNLTDKIYQNADFVLEIDNNLGHLKGSSQLLLESIKLIPDDCKYTILLEADTWIFSDNLIDEYVNKLDSQNAIWATGPKGGCKNRPYNSTFSVSLRRLKAAGKPGLAHL